MPILPGPPTSSPPVVPSPQPLVGTTILSSRRLIPDPCQALSAPSAAAFTSSQFASANTLTPGTYLVSITFFTGFGTTYWGETTPTALTSVVVDGAHGIQVNGTLPVGVAKMRVYFGIGAINQYQDSTTASFQIIAPGIAGVPPTTNRAFLPDTDGNFVSAQAVFEWLNEALDKATDISGGILDVSGAFTTNGVNMYKFLGSWIKLVDIYFDGFLVYGGNRRQVFRRSPNASISGITVRVTLTPQTIVELYPQPNRTAAIFTSTNSIAATDTSVSYTVVSGTLLTNMGLASLGGNTSTPEIVAYSASSTPTLSNLVRGLGGTQPQSWPIGTQINELNLAFGGARRAIKFTVGDSARNLLVAPGWESLLPRYVEARFRETEHEWKTATDLMKSFESEIKLQQGAYKQLSGPCQVSDDYYGGAVDDFYGSGLGGRWAIP